MVAFNAVEAVTGSFRWAVLTVGLVALATPPLIRRLSARRRRRAMATGKPFEAKAYLRTAELWRTPLPAMARPGGRRRWFPAAEGVLTVDSGGIEWSPAWLAARVGFRSFRIEPRIIADVRVRGTRSGAVLDLTFVDWATLGIRTEDADALRQALAQHFPRLPSLFAL